MKLAWMMPPAPVMFSTMIAWLPGMHLPRWRPGKEKGTFYLLCMDQRLFTQVVLGLPARESPFEHRIAFTPEDRRVFCNRTQRFEFDEKTSRAPIPLFLMSDDTYQVFAIAKTWQTSCSA